MNTTGITADAVLKSVLQRIDYECYFLKLTIENMQVGPERTCRQTQYNALVCIRQWIAIDYSDRKGGPEVAPKPFVWDGPPANKRLFFKDDGTIFYGKDGE